MTPPRTPYDDELRAFVDEQDEEEFVRTTRSRPPPSALHAAREVVVGRFREKTESGIHDIEKLNRLLEDKIRADNAEKLLALKRRADDAEAEVKRRDDEKKAGKKERVVWLLDLLKLLVAALAGVCYERWVR